MEPNIYRRRRLVLAGLAAVVVFWLIFGLRDTGRELDAPAEATDVDYSTQANLEGGETLLPKLGSLDALAWFRRDVLTFARTAYPEYGNNTDRVVGFKLTDNIKEAGEELSFEGRYGSVGNSIKVSIKKLNYDRLKMSIADSKTGLNIDPYLPSNTERNQFIGALPINKDNFSVDYSPSDDSFVVFVSPTSSRGISKAFEQAEKAIKDGLGLNNLSSQRIEIIRSNTSVAPN